MSNSTANQAPAGPQGPQGHQGPSGISVEVESGWPGPRTWIDETGWTVVAHDHRSPWIPKEKWILRNVAWQDWRRKNSVFDFDQQPSKLVEPLRWEFRDEQTALLFLLSWS
jgi:hypothetical protein